MFAESEETQPAGDAACWLNRVCAECGAISDNPRAELCERCGRELPREPGVE